MKTKRYSFALVFLIAFLLLSGDIFAQRGRHRHHHSYGRYYPVRHYPRGNFYFNQSYVSIRFGNSYYRYQHGYFYRPFGATFRVIVPPFGIRIGTLPLGYRRFYIGPDPYYYYRGIYYRPYTGNQYEVVAPPLGAVVDELPPGAKLTVIDGKKYYELSGTYYEESITADSELQYTVVGTDGVLNTGNADNTDNTDTTAAHTPAIGDRLENLPADSKAVVINNEKLYLAPSGLYYKEVIEGNKVYYEVVGK